MALSRSDAHKTMLSVPGTREKSYFARPAIFSGDHFVGCVHQKHEAVVLTTSSIGMRDLMLEAEPRLFYITDHYRPWAGLLVRLSALDRPTLKALLKARMAQLAQKPAKAKKKLAKKAALQKRPQRKES
jgi:hypothetical protein